MPGGLRFAAWAERSVSTPEWPTYVRGDSQRGDSRRGDGQGDEGQGVDTQRPCWLMASSEAATV